MQTLLLSHDQGHVEIALRPPPPPRPMLWNSGAGKRWRTIPLAPLGVRAPERVGLRAHEILKSVSATVLIDASHGVQAGADADLRRRGLNMKGCAALRASKGTARICEQGCDCLFLLLDLF